jgi:hypothetical protein
MKLTIPLLILIMHYESFGEEDNPFDFYLKNVEKEQGNSKESDDAKVVSYKLLKESVDRKEDIKFLFSNSKAKRILSFQNSSKEAHVILEAIRKHGQVVEETESEAIGSLFTDLTKTKKVGLEILYYDVRNKPETASFLRILQEGKETFEFQINVNKCPEFFKIWMELHDTQTDKKSP